MKRKIRNKNAKLQRRTTRFSFGFTLIEIAVVLAVSAAIGLAIWKLLPSLRNTANGDVARIALLEAQQALDGFIVINHRLPCPAANSGGDEDCTITGGVGLLPHRTLGLANTVEAQTLRYGVYRQPNVASPVNDADLATLVVRYYQYMPTAVAAVNANGLDFCVGVGKAMAFASPTALRVGAVGMPAAYAIAHRGANNTFDGANASAAGFALGAEPQTVSYDDRVLATGLPELFGRLNCPERLGLANGAARSAFAAYDVDRVAAEYLKYCEFGELTAINDVVFGTLGVALAATNLALVVVGGIIGLALDIVTKSLSIAITVPLFVLNSGLAVAATGAAITALGLASAGLDGARKQKAAAISYKSVTANRAAVAYADAVALRRKGLII